jgi:hypothetical protein
MSQSLDVVFIAGSGRSGSTLLDRVLGTHSRCTSHNELRAIPHRGIGENQICACGQTFADCTFWQRVMQVSGIDQNSIPDLIRQQLKFNRLVVFPLVYFNLYGPRARRELADYRESLGRLYRAIAVVSGKPVIVDSSKIATHAAILSGIPGIRLHILHLVRDVRYVAHAWANRKLDPGTGKPMRYMSPWRTALTWLVENLFAGMLGRRAAYLRLRYEDFVATPQAMLDRICNTFEPLQNGRIMLENGNAISLPTIHAISGNPDRFRTGTTIIEERGASRTRAGMLLGALILTIGLPFLWSYGYLRPSRSSGSTSR